jgi:hypothetical protein
MLYARLQHALVHHRFTLVIAALALGFTCSGGIADAGPIQQAEGALRQVWTTDPVTVKQAWPTLELLPKGTRPLEQCPEAPGANPESRSVYCPVTKKILLDPERLESEYGDVQQFGAWGAGYWIAVALSKAIQRELIGGGGSALARNLQANCLAGVLLTRAAPHGLEPQRPSDRHAPAFAAYSGEWTASQGSPAQRSYALLSGFGITEADCSEMAMADLAVNRVSDLQLLKLIKENPPNRATDDADFKLVLTALCRPRPGRPCPPSLPLNQRGVTQP